MEDNMRNIGDRIRKRRKELGLTQTDVFNECGIASGALSQIENGSRTPSILIFHKLSQVLKCDMEWLLTGISAYPKNLIPEEFFATNNNEYNLIHYYRGMLPHDQEDILMIAEMKYRRTKEQGKSSLSPNEKMA